jgi:hypothetical protein
VFNSGESRSQEAFIPKASTIIAKPKQLVLVSKTCFIGMRRMLLQKPKQLVLV